MTELKKKAKKETEKETKQSFRCEVCGNVVDEVPETCPVCSSGKDRYKKA